MAMRRPIAGSADDDAATSDASAPARQPLDYLFGPPEPEPAAAPDARQRAIRYERGSTVYALDGPVGTLRQVVIDEAEAEVKALVVRDGTKGESILVPPDLVDKNVGTALFLNVSREQFQLGASRTPRFDARMFSAADAKAVVRTIPLAFRGRKERSVVDVRRDSLVTSEVLEPTAVPPRQAKWSFFSRGRARPQPPSASLSTEGEGGASS